MVSARTGYLLGGTLLMPNEAHGSSDVKQKLTHIWCEVLKTDMIDADDSFFALGGDSISSLLIAVKAAEAGIKITALQILEQETIAKLAEVAELSSASLQDAESEDGAFGEMELTPIQHWFFEQDHPDINHWNKGAFLDVNEQVNESVLHQALTKVVEHHEALRSKFFRRDGKWIQSIPDEVCIPRLDLVDLRFHDDDHSRVNRMRLASMAAQERIDIASGRLVSAVLFKRESPRLSQLLLLIHHLVVDSVSMRIVIQDLDATYRMLNSGKEVRLPRKTVSFRSWQKALAQYSTSPAVLNQLHYWRAAQRADFAAGDLGNRPGLVDPKNTAGRARTVRVTVPEHIVSELINSGYRMTQASLRDILLACFLLAWHQQTGRSDLQLDLEGHGREPLGRSVNVTRTVGWFTAIYPTVLSVHRPGSRLDVLRAVHEQLQRIPERGICYGILRYLSGPSGSELGQLTRSQISFNYLGWLDEASGGHLFGPPMPGPWLLQNGEDTRRYLLEIIISGSRGQIDADFVYAGDFYLERNVKELANRYLNILDEISASLAACSLPPSG